MRSASEDQYPWSSCKRNPWNRFGFFLMVGGFVAYSFVGRGRKR